MTVPATCRISNVFYEQYLTVVPEGLFMLGICLVPTFIVCCLLLGMDVRSGLINLFSIVMILVDTVGFMTLWNITYNAVSLINLVTVTRGPRGPSLGAGGCRPPRTLPVLSRVSVPPAGLGGDPCPGPLVAEAPCPLTGGGHLCGVCVPHHPLLCHQHQAHTSGEG